MRNPWRWVPSLFAAEEIPSAIVTFVALLMFLQIGVSPTLSTLYAALLFLPWVLKSFFRAWVRRVGRFRDVLHWIEAVLFLALLSLAFSFPYGPGWLFASLMLVSLLSAWHELTARMYYERMLYPRLQRYFNGPKVFFSQMAVIMTYGALIIIVGVLQVFFRQICPAWSMGCYICAGIFSLFALYHLVILRRPEVGDRTQYHSMAGSVMAEVHVIERIRRLPNWWLSVLTIFLLMLPQSLMFYARVLYLLDKEDAGGLGCTIQEIGYAQGTVGVIAFSLGITIGRRLMRWIPKEHLFWPFSILLGLSPCVYLMMTMDPPSSLPVLCIATFQAQLLFGLGLNVCRISVQYISGERYRNTINLLYIPMVSACMIGPMALSGWLVQQLGYHTFFLIDVLTAPAGWLILYVLRHAKRVALVMLPLLFVLNAHAVTYTRQDSLKVVQLLQQGSNQSKETNLMLYYAHQLEGIPYVASTLEVNKTEELVVNLRQLDCTTLVETVTALTLVTENDDPTWDNYCKWLTMIRYRNGKCQGYGSRNHYFSQWIQSNQDLGLVEEICGSKSDDYWPFTGTQKLALHFMTQHPEKYPRMKGDQLEQMKVQFQEMALADKTVRYIPVSLLNKSQEELKCVQDGNILALVTSKDGLDVSHLGLAEWGKDGKLHLLNASSIHHKVVLESMTLQQYMLKHPSQVGIRVIRVL